MATEEGDGAEDVDGGQAEGIASLGAALVDRVLEAHAAVRGEASKVRSGVQVVNAEEFVRVDVQKPIDVAVGVRPP